MAALVTGAVAALAYAAWAFTARRGIFADFAAGNSVSGDDAKSSDTIDTIFLIVVGVVVLVALGLWIARMAARKSQGGAVDISGIALAALGLVSVLVGLYLASTIVDADGQAAQGDKGVTATLVVGGGFALLAVGLLIGVFTVRGRGDTADSRSGQHGAGAGYQTW
jgi:heme/copper-type cytochrome/quinol oxidase subunit 2